MTFPLRHIPFSLPFFVGPFLGPPHLLPFIGQLSVFCWPRVFSFRLSKRGAPSPLSPTDAWERVRRGRERATAAAASTDRPREDSERRPRSRVETGNSSLVSHMDGPPRRGRVHETTSVRAAGRPARASTPPCFPAECFPPDDGRRRRHAERRGEGDQEGNRRALSRYSQHYQREK